MTQTKFATNRNYGAPQILTIEFTPIDDDTDAQMDFHSVSFIDAVRNISGKVKIFGMDCNIVFIGAAVLREYDAGRYTTK